MIEKPKLIASSVLLGAGTIGICTASMGDNKNIYIPIVVGAVGLILLSKEWTGYSVRNHWKNFIMWVKGYDNLENRMKEIEKSPSDVPVQCSKKPAKIIAEKGETKISANITKTPKKSIDRKKSLRKKSNSRDRLRSRQKHKPKIVTEVVYNTSVSVNKSASKAKPTEKTTKKPATKTAKKPVVKTAKKPATKTARKSATKTAKKSAAKTAKKPATKTTN